MDPVTLCFVVAAPVFFVVCYVFFNMATRESSFEETYGKEALKLLTEDKKSKVKNGKLNKKLTKNEKKTTYDKSENLLGTTTETVKIVTEVVRIIDIPDEPAEELKVERKNSDASQPKSIEISKSTAKKNKKKARKNLESENSQKVDEENSREKSQDKNVVEEKAPVQNIGTSRKKREVTEIGTVNLNKLIERLTFSPEIEPEYLSFVCQFAEQANKKEVKLNELVSKLQREISSKTYELEHLHDQLYDSQTNAAQIQSLESALKEAKEKHAVYVSSAIPKLSENHQLRETVRKLEESISTQNKTHASAMDKLKRESEQICNSMRNSLTQANNYLQQKDILIKEMEKDFQQQINSVKEKESEFGEKDSIIEELKNAIQQKDRFIEEIEEGIKQKDALVENLTEEFKQKENYLIQAKDEQIKLANSKLEIELKESLQRIDELRSRNYKLVESINALYNNKNPLNNSDENKKPITESPELKA